MMQETFNSKILGAQIRKQTQLRGWSQEELAELMDVSPATVRRWMSGETTPDLPNFCRLVDLFQVSMQELVFGKTTGEPETPTIYYRDQPIITLTRSPRDAYEELGLRVAQQHFQGVESDECLNQLPIPNDTYERAVWCFCNMVLTVKTDNIPLDEELSEKLKEQFRLRVCRVADLGSAHPIFKTVVLGALGAQEISELSRQSDIRLRVGLAGGFTCGQVVASLLQAQNLPKLDVIPIAVHSNQRVVDSDANTLVGMLGFFSRGTDLRVYGLPFVSNDRLDHDLHNDSYEPTRRMLDIARRVDVALLGLGGDLNYFFYHQAALSAEEDLLGVVSRFELQQKKCIGDILYTLVTREGPMEAFRQYCDQLTCSIGLEGLARLVQNRSHVITIVAGAHKADVTRLALEKRYVDGLIIDSKLARAILEDKA